MKCRRTFLVILLFTLCLHFPNTAQAEASRQELWSWMMQLPSMWMDGFTSLWQREGSTIDPFGQPGPAPEAHPAGGQSEPTLDGVRATIDPAGEPKAGAGISAEGDIGHTIDPMG